MATSFLPLAIPTTPSHRPYVSSPLSMRSPNTCVLSSSPTPLSPKYLKSASNPPPRRFTTKNTPPNRVTRDRETQSAKRRVDLLKLGKDRRERRVWAGREEQILQSNYREQQRRWEEEQVRAMREVGAEVEDAEASSPIMSPANDIDFDQMMLSQEAELEAMYSSRSDAKLQKPDHHHDEDQMDDREDMTTEYGSDDAEYDELFMGLAVKAERTNRETDLGQDMDTEMG